MCSIRDGAAETRYGYSPLPAAIPDRRVDEVLELVDLSEAGSRRVGGYSMGMRQRLGLAAALLGDPATVVLDEPANGLDPMGVRWLRTLLRDLADQGRTVLVSSHQLAELAQTVDDVIVIDHGRLVAGGSMRDLVSNGAAASLEDLFLELGSERTVLMRTLVSSEYLSSRTLRLPALLLTIGTVFSAAIGVGGRPTQKAGATVDVTQAARAVTAPMWFLVAVVAILASAGEFQHHTIRTTLLSTPRRINVLVSKALVIGGYGAAMTALGMTASIAAVLVTAQVDGTPLDPGDPTAWSGLAGAALAGALFAVLASALGMLTGGTALALTVLLLWYFVGEGVLPVVLRQPGISDWTPTGAATTLVDPASQQVTTVLASGAALVGYAAVFSAVAAWTFVHRDAD